ncbi:hypothetical protein QQG74_03145 [Micromonospora sp. FIMYZ51]|uniref:hypothetical protein n=1 Tax=Micromonospora sp. FIMYZ51 TaxID=3051832 RepID=UPI00311D386F
MEHVDTMIVSYAWKGVSGYAIDGRTLSSVAAQEFLLVHTKDLKTPRYYMPRPPHLRSQGPSLLRVGEKGLSGPQQHARRRKYTDRLFIDFASDHPTIFEYGHNRLAGAINGGEIQYYETCIRDLDRQLRRDLLGRFTFLVHNRVKCVALTPKTVESMFPLLNEFSRTNNPKKNFRNTINDMLVLSTALEGRASLFSKDEALNRFAADFYRAPFKRVASHALCIDFDGGASNRRQPIESKGYVNRSWQVIERRG